MPEEGRTASRKSPRVQRSRAEGVRPREGDDSRQSREHAQSILDDGPASLVGYFTNNRGQKLPS